MKKLALIIVILLTHLRGTHAQVSSNPAQYVGIDIVKSIPSFILPEKYLIRKTIIIEPYYRRAARKPNRNIILGGGFAKGTTNSLSNFDPNQRFRGYYLRGSYEIKHPRINHFFGFGPMVSLSQYKGNISFEGPTFGNYERQYEMQNQFAIGFEAYFAHGIKLSDRLSLRIQVRNTAALRPSPEVPSQYFPGVGYTPPRVNKSFLYSGSFSLQLFYRTR